VIGVSGECSESISKCSECSESISKCSECSECSEGSSYSRQRLELNSNILFNIDVLLMSCAFISCMINMSSSYLEEIVTYSAKLNYSGRL